MKGVSAVYVEIIHRELKIPRAIHMIPPAKGSDMIKHLSLPKGIYFYRYFLQKSVNDALSIHID